MLKLLCNADIYTMDRSNPIVENVLVENGKIVALNVDNKIEYQKVDLEGKTLIPGLCDSHLHTVMYGSELDKIDLSAAKSIADLIELGKNHIEDKDLKKDDWIFGWGWNQENFEEDSLPTAKDLDEISKNYPIVLKRECRHVLTANTAALKAAGLYKKNIANKRVYKDEKGNPNGVLCEDAQKLILDAAPKTTVEDIKNYIIDASKKYLEYGLTFVQSDDLADSSISFHKTLQAYFELADSGKLPLRYNLQLRLTNEKDLKEFIANYKTGNYNDYLTLGPLKIWADGSLGARTAALRESYNNLDSAYGELLCSREKMENLVKIACENKMQVACHAIGDRTIEQFVEIVESMQEEYTDNLRHRIIHSQLADYQLLKRMKATGINTDIQPAFTASDWEIVENRIGKDREQQSYLWKDMIDLGINTAGSSDSPIEKPDPIWGISCLVSRKDELLKPEFGWLPNQKVTVQDALEIYTKNGAYNAFVEDKFGQIKPGYKADFSILSQNPFYVKEDKLREIEVCNTIIDGNLSK
ncbi:Exoenzymes regulatory protein AepA precursor [Halanaerobium saccharolyticum subsp. saccharolyticum DSM 6643]|uniref:Exoenzymes regulatory protein AepA n=1 Tax=Halanaerobium saccharolyticum subsp. saccharolyticum DSM 6643 TaxID=1293054 RepID=M5DWX0_9FIRM|nr:amidohydrolase [Halanaerobium saccharolyticum]CCU77865.1 Exoenzymes regulatory protein AepA precursor [Halanaerobium saccharolyticum subsp. saccharolyticum DSM 6643]